MGEHRRSVGYFENDERTTEEAYNQGKEDAKDNTLIDKWARSSYEVPESVADDIVDADARSEQEKAYDAGVEDADKESSWW